MKFNDSAFPVRNRWDTGNEEFDLQDSGMNLQQYAAIHLKVPMSGDPELDKMIRESRKLDLVGQAFEGMLASEIPEEGWVSENMAQMVCRFVDALLAEWEKEAGK